MHAHNADVLHPSKLQQLQEVELLRGLGMSVPNVRMAGKVCTKGHTQESGSRHPFSGPVINVDVWDVRFTVSRVII